MRDRCRRRKLIYRHSLGGAVVAAGLLLGSVAARAQLSLAETLSLHGHAVSASSASAATLPAAPATVEEALHALAEQAAFIFAGEVLQVEHERGAVRIDLRVEQGFRGVSTGQTYTMRQWAGLWTAGEPGLRTGQRALFLLRAPSVGGFSSPVGGADGIIPLLGDTVSAAVDLRWLAAGVCRSTQPRADNAPDSGGPVDPPSRAPATGKSHPGRVQPSAAHRRSAAVNGIAWVETDPALTGAVRAAGVVTASATTAPVDLRAVDLNLVSGLLRAWSRSAPADTEAR